MVSFSTFTIIVIGIVAAVEIAIGIRLTYLVFKKD
jgi:NADH:ubiquinone oxidoreductase subunit K